MIFLNMCNDSGKNQQSIDLIDIDKEAYSTLIEWAESAPLILKELEVKGDQRDIKKFKIHIKLVVQKLQDIQRLMTKNR